MRYLGGVVALCAALLTTTARAGEIGRHVPVKVVVVTTFEIGNDTGDTPGEFQNWVENLPLPDTLPFPQGYHPLRFNPDKGVLGIVTGEGPTRMASSITALANDPRFDLRHSYWVLAGIAGIDPNVASVGSAAWAEYVVDGDLAYEIDAREIPPDWSTGYVPLNRSAPYQPPTPDPSSQSGTNLFHLNAGLVNWAVALTADTPLADTPDLQAIRARYTGFPNAQRPPFVLKGDTLAAGTFWIGSLLNQWAENWVRYWSGNKATFTTTAEEDAGMMQALTFLSQVNKVDLNRVLVLRTASDYDLPPPGQTAAELLASEVGDTGYSGFIPSVNAAYAVGSRVVNELVRGWDYYEGHIPSAAP